MTGGGITEGVVEEAALEWFALMATTRCLVRTSRWEEQRPGGRRTTRSS